MNRWIPLIVVADVIVTAAFLWIVLRRVRLGAGLQPGFDFAGLRAFADEIHARVGEYVPANYGGDPAMLPRVLGSLLSEIEGKARARGLEVPRETLKAILVRSASAHHVARAADLRAAIARVA